MSVALQAVKFNHIAASATTDALNIRRNGSAFVTVPEWQSGVSVRPEDSPAAYALSAVQGNTVTIQASFRRIDPTLTTVEVRAVDEDVDPPGPGGCVGVIIRIIRELVRALAGNVLGEVKARTVTFAADDSGFETFELHKTRLGRAGVGVYTTTWRWQYSTDGRTWIDFPHGPSRHRVYLLVAPPTAPWQQAPYTPDNTQLPWTEVLDRACPWARLATNRTEAAAKVTRAVYDLGPNVVTYDCPGGGSTHYGWGSFNCTAFLDRLAGGVGNGQYVNCTDCAMIVSTFANALGCDLWQSRMEEFFELNPALAIGSSTWEQPCGWSHFWYHEVAWIGACTENDEVFDACLQLDGSADPTAPPHTPLLPVNLLFGVPGDGNYRSRLCPPTPGGAAICDPQPHTRRRRVVM